MATNGERAYELLQAKVGEAEGTGEWFEVTQDLINLFADATHDHQWIHVNPKQAEEMSPWKATIAHGFLTLSLLTHLTGSIGRDPAPYEGIVMGINYGFDKVRFVTPVKVGSRVRASSTLADVTLRDPNTVQAKRAITVEIDGEAKPALAAEWLTVMSYS
ncbi:MAG TPA: MaoC family dehydratase [Acidimicrobiales bacterium]|jgi:acyl dehydratase|nr:MaoC family dehydratase [Acidimicrobiales bacterium]